MKLRPDDDRRALPDVEEAHPLFDAGVRFVRLADDLPFVPAGPYEPRLLQLTLRGGFLVLLVLAALWPSLSGDWMWQDDRLIVSDVSLRTLRGLGAIWADPLAFTPPGLRTFWWAELHALGANAPAWRFVSAGLHLSTVLILWLGMRRLGVTGAWLIAALFALHPMILGNVAWPSRQGELLGSFAAATAFWAFLAARQIQPDPDERSWTDPAFYVDREEDEAPRWPWFIFVPAVLVGLSVGSAAGVIAAAAAWLVDRRFYTERGRRIAIVLSLWAATSLAARLLFPVATATVAPPMGVSGPRWAEIVAALPWTLAHAAWPAEAPLVYDRSGWSSIAWLVGCGTVTIAVLVLPFVRRTAWTWSLAAAAVLAILHGLPLLREKLPMVVTADLLPYAAAFAVIAGVTGLMLRRLRRHTGETANRVVRWLFGIVAIGLLGTLTAVRAADLASVDRAWQATLRLTPEGVVARTELAASYMNEGFLDEAGMQLDRVAEEKRDVSWLLARGRVFDAQKRFADAVGVYERAHQAAPSDQAAVVALAEALTNVGDAGRAATLYETAVANTASPDAGLLTNAGLAQMRIGQPKKAADLYEKALLLDPQFVPAHLNLSNTQFELGDLEASSRHLQEVVKLDPRNFAAFLNAGVLLYRLHDPVKAERMFRVAIQLNPQSAEAFADLGIVLAVQGKESEAAWSFSQALRIDPGHQSRVLLEQLRRKPTTRVAASQPAN